MRRDMTTELQDFITDLEIWARNWVDEVNQVIVEHIDDLFKDESIRYLVKKYKETKLKYDKMNKGYLLSACMYGDKVSKYQSFDLDTYSQALYELCYKRYIEGEKDNA